MNIGSINNLQTNNQNFGSRLHKSRIKYANELDDVAKDFINNWSQKIEKHAKMHDTFVTFAQKKGIDPRSGKEFNALVFNSNGSITSSFNINEFKNKREALQKFAKSVIMNIKANHIAKSQGLQNGLRAIF